MLRLPYGFAPLPPGMIKYCSLMTTCWNCNNHYGTWEQDSTFLVIWWLQLDSQVKQSPLIRSTQTGMNKNNGLVAAIHEMLLQLQKNKTKQTSKNSVFQTAPKVARLLFFLLLLWWLHLNHEPVWKPCATFQTHSTQIFKNQTQPQSYICSLL